MAGVVREGLHELQAALAKADRETRLGVRGGLRKIAEPVQRGAEQLAMSAIPNMSRSPRWSRMRIGVTRDLVYVSPRERGLRGRSSLRRPNLGTLLMDRAMQPALDAHTGEIVARFEALLDHVADDFNH